MTCRKKLIAKIYPQILFQDEIQPWLQRPFTHDFCRRAGACGKLAAGFTDGGDARGQFVVERRARRGHFRKMIIHNAVVPPTLRAAHVKRRAIDIVPQHGIALLVNAVSRHRRDKAMRVTARLVARAFRMSASGKV